jgi:hypothetical protein
VPQWVIDEAAGRQPVATAWRAPAVAAPVARPRGRVRRTGRVLALLALTSAVVVWWVTGGEDWVRTTLGPGTGIAAAPAPSAEVVALADEAHLSEEGRGLLFDARPALLDATAFAGQCTQGPAAVVADGTVGCYRPGDGTIVVYVPADARLRGFVVETVAHETLHVAWETLTDAERTELAGLLDAVVAALPADDPIHEQIAGSVGKHEENRPTELFAYVGTQVAGNGGLGERLESVYARFVSDRAALVAVHTDFEAARVQRVDAIEAGYTAVLATESANAQERAQVEAEIDAAAGYRATYEAEVARLDALPEQQRGLTNLSWTWWDGTELPMAPADQTLAAAATLLAEAERTQQERLVAVGSAEAAAAAERARVDALRADHEALETQLQP